MGTMKCFEFERLWRPGELREPGYLVVDDSGNVVSIPQNPPAGAQTEKVEGFALPGVVNLHSHAFQRAMVGRAEEASGTGDNFWSWRKAMYELVGRLSPDQVEAIAAQLYVEMLQAGYTTVAEFHYLHHDQSGQPYDDRAEIAKRLVAAAERAGISLVLLPVLYMTRGFGGEGPQSAQREVRQYAGTMLPDHHCDR